MSYTNDFEYIIYIEIVCRDFSMAPMDWYMSKATSM